MDQGNLAFASVHMCMRIRSIRSAILWTRTPHTFHLYYLSYTTHQFLRSGRVIRITALYRLTIQKNEAKLRLTTRWLHAFTLLPKYRRHMHPTNSCTQYDICTPMRIYVTDYSIHIVCFVCMYARERSTWDLGLGRVMMVLTRFFSLTS